MWSTPLLVKIHNTFKVNIFDHDEHQISNFWHTTKALEKHVKLGHSAFLFHWILYETYHLQAFCQPEENPGETN